MGITESPTTNRQMVEYLKRLGVLKTPLLIDAFLQTDRVKFVKSKQADQAYHDTPLPIGAGQTISQPQTVALMLELLQPQPGHKILDIGAGSGWTTALLARAVGPKGRVIGLEILPNLAQVAHARLARTNITNAEVRLGSGYSGLKDEAPFERILASASASELPEELPLQLSPHGILVLPVGEQIKMIRRGTLKRYKSQSFAGFAFVPLLGEGGGYGVGEYR